MEEVKVALDERNNSKLIVARHGPPEAIRGQRGVNAAAAAVRRRPRGALQAPHAVVSQQGVRTLAVRVPVSAAALKQLADVLAGVRLQQLQGGRTDGSDIRM